MENKFKASTFKKYSDMFYATMAIFEIIYILILRNQMSGNLVPVLKTIDVTIAIVIACIEIFVNHYEKWIEHTSQSQFSKDIQDIRNNKTIITSIKTIIILYPILCLILFFLFVQNWF